MRSLSSFLEESCCDSFNVGSFLKMYRFLGARHPVSGDKVCFLSARSISWLSSPSLFEETCIVVLFGRGLKQISWSSNCKNSGLCTLPLSVASLFKKFREFLTFWEGTSSSTSHKSHSASSRKDDESIIKAIRGY